MEIHQIQVYYWDDGAHIVKEYFFATKELADRAMFDLNDLRDKQEAELLLELDSDGNPLYDEDNVWHMLSDIRRRVITVCEEWTAPALKQYIGDEYEEGQRNNWVDCDKSHINWNDWL